jgi:hypothetical protein
MSRPEEIPVSVEAADARRALNAGYPFHWRALEADQSTYFYKSVREDGTVRNPYAYEPRPEV